MDDWLQHFSCELDAIALQRRSRIRGGAQRGTDLVDFSSNDYLGLSSHPSVVAAMQSVTLAGSGASPVLSGHHAQHGRLDDALAELCGMEAAISFSSGYACNVGVIASLAGSNDWILSDELNHASLIDGCRLSRAETTVYPHCDIGQLRALLEKKRANYRRVLVLTETIFSMDGDEAPLAEILELAQRYSVGVVIDEAHATGVVGSAGGGLLQRIGHDQQVIAKLGTLSKAIGCIGGFVAGSQPLIDFLVNRCRSYVFSTAPAPAAVAAATAAVSEIPVLGERRSVLRARSIRLRTALREQGWEVPEGESCIVPVVVGSEASVLSLQSDLISAGYYAPAIRPPTVPEGKCRLRISVTLDHDDECLEHFVSTMGKCRRT